MAIRQINQEWAARRSQELAQMAQLEAERQEQQASKQAEQQAFAERVQATRNGAKPHIPTWQEIGDQNRRDTLAAEQARKAAQIAALTPHDIWKSTLNLAQRKRVETWEAINGMNFPLDGSIAL